MKKITVHKQSKSGDIVSLKCLSVIVPVYNEVLSIKEILSRIKAVPLPIEIILIDDCSTDGTREILKNLELSQKNLAPDDQDNKFIRVLYHEKNQGKGAAIRTGVQHAKGDIVIIQDADMEYDPAEYPKLVEPILSGDADVVYGSRFRGERIRIHLFWHTLGNKFLTLFSNMLTNLNLSDMETCYKVFKTEIIKSIPLRSNRFGFEPEITAKLAKLRCRIYEIPINYSGRSYAEGKKIGWKDGVSAIYTIIKYWLIDDLYEKGSGLRTLRIMEGAGKYNQWLFNQVKKHLGKKVVEGGSGVGNITKYLLNKERIVATDLEKSYLDELNRKYRHIPHFHCQSFNLMDKDTSDQIKKDFSPDTFLSMNVVEHIKDDGMALKNIYNCLTPGGKAVILVPAHMLLFSEMDKNLGHYRRYTKKTLNSLIKNAGFEVEKTFYLNFIGAIGWFINGRILRRKLVPSRQVRWFDLIIALLFIEKILPFPFGLSVVAVGKKPN